MNITNPNLNKAVVVVYGPPASGKTLNAQALAEVLKCDCISEDDFSRDDVPATANRVLVLTSDPQGRVAVRTGKRRRMVEIEGAQKMNIRAAKGLLGDRWIEPREDF